MKKNLMNAVKHKDMTIIGKSAVYIPGHAISMGKIIIPDMIKYCRIKDYTERYLCIIHDGQSVGQMVSPEHVMLKEDYDEVKHELVKKNNT